MRRVSARILPHDAALLDHADDTLKIAGALKARGVDLAELDAMIK